MPFVECRLLGESDHIVGRRHHGRHVAHLGRVVQDAAKGNDLSHETSLKVALDLEAIQLDRLLLADAALLPCNRHLLVHRGDPPISGSSSPRRVPDFTISPYCRTSKSSWPAARSGVVRMSTETTSSGNSSSTTDRKRGSLVAALMAFSMISRARFSCAGSIVPMQPRNSPRFFSETNTPARPRMAGCRSNRPSGGVMTRKSRT